MLICCTEALDPQDGCHSCQVREIFAHVLQNSHNNVRNVRNVTIRTNVHCLFFPGCTILIPRILLLPEFSIFGM